VEGKAGADPGDRRRDQTASGGLTGPPSGSPACRPPAGGAKPRKSRISLNLFLDGTRARH
jgi:hypothetical protein